MKRSAREPQAGPAGERAEVACVEANVQQRRRGRRPDRGPRPPHREHDVLVELGQSLSELFRDGGGQSPVPAEDAVEAPGRCPDHESGRDRDVHAGELAEARPQRADDGRVERRP